MGPRPFSRGKVKEWFGPDYACGFNGAATFQSRKVLEDSVQRANDACFNGAATFQSRKDGVRQGHAPESSASMGPRPFSRGKSTRRNYSVFKDLAASLRAVPWSDPNLPNQTTQAFPQDIPYQQL